MTKTVERVTTLHPTGKQGVRIERAKYDEMRRALLRVIPRTKAGVPFMELRDLVHPLLSLDVFDAKTSVSWYVTTVKQDIEARGLVQQLPGRGPQRLQRIVSR